MSVLELTESLPTSFAAAQLSKQLIRSATSTALNYGEAQAAESRADFIHKMKVVLKELKESFVCLKILDQKKYLEMETSKLVLGECNELISMFVTSLKTAQGR